MIKHTQSQLEKQAKSQRMERELFRFLKPLLSELNQGMDRRLVSTFFGLVMAILLHRHRNNGLLLSELGSYLLGPERCRAGARRISRLIHSEKWKAKRIVRFMWQRATERVEAAWAEEERPLVIWDESVIEKPESLHAEGLCPVRSTKAVRLKRIKPGFFNPPGGRPVFVPGFKWLQVLVIGRKGPPTVAHLRWWTTRGERKQKKRKVEQAVLRKIDALWGKEVLHIWDRGFAGSPWLTTACLYAARFVMRWPKHYKLIDEEGSLRKAWEINRGKRSWEHRYLWDARRRCQRKTGIVAFEVMDPLGEIPLWLVVARRGQGQSPWYLLTTQTICSPDDAWQVVLAYARRWQVEMAIRYCKCELAFECPRLRKWQHRHKLLSIASLAFAFLLSLLAPALASLCRWLLHAFCHRTGKRSRETPAPLYRLRLALYFLWLNHPPPFFSFL
jgi:hypothetical protein